MKIVINYDFFNAIKDVKEGINPFKIIRNNKYRYAILGPVWYTINLSMGDDIISNMITMAFSYSTFIGLDMLEELFYKKVSGIYMHINPVIS